MAQRAQANRELGGELRLREARAPANRLHVDLRRDVQLHPAHALALLVPDRLSQSVSDTRERLAHLASFAYPLRTCTSLASSFRSAWLRSTFSPFPNTVRRYSGSTSL